MSGIALAAALAALAAATVVRPVGRRALAVRGVVRPDTTGGRPVVGLVRVPARLAVWRRRRRLAARRAATVELCTALAAELRSGVMPGEALQRPATAVPGVCDQAARLARLGGDVSAALVADSLRPGAGGMANLAALWSVSQHTGARLAEGCEQIADWLRDDESLRREVAAQLAGARASARLLAVLPVLGIVLGSGMGARPLHVLVGTPYGIGCLVVGTALAALGLWWTERLARAVEDDV